MTPRERRSRQAIADLHRLYDIERTAATVWPSGGPWSLWTDGTGTTTAKDADGRVLSIDGPSGPRERNKYGERVGDV
jgi:hypothetical protein